MSEEKVDRLRITDRFRSKNGFVYDIRYEGSRLTLFIAPRENADDAGDWKVEASTRPPAAAEPFSITQWGLTRVAALQEVGRSWVSESSSHGLPRFDWAAVEKALMEVRAL
jgi:hypothetical protein